MIVPETCNLGLDMSVWLTFKPPDRILSHGTHRKISFSLAYAITRKCTAAGSLVLSYKIRPSKERESPARIDRDLCSVLPGSSCSTDPFIFQYIPPPLHYRFPPQLGSLFLHRHSAQPTATSTLKSGYLLDWIWLHCGYLSPLDTYSSTLWLHFSKRRNGLFLRQTGYRRDAISSGFWWAERYIEIRFLGILSEKLGLIRYRVRRF